MMCPCSRLLVIISALPRARTPGPPPHPDVPPDSRREERIVAYMLNIPYHQFKFEPTRIKSGRTRCISRYRWDSSGRLLLTGHQTVPGLRVLLVEDLPSLRLRRTPEDPIQIVMPARTRLGVGNGKCDVEAGGHGAGNSECILSLFDRLSLRSGNDQLLSIQRPALIRGL